MDIVGKGRGRSIVDTKLIYEALKKIQLKIIND